MTAKRVNSKESNYEDREITTKEFNYEDRETWARGLSQVGGVKSTRPRGRLR